MGYLDQLIALQAQVNQQRGSFITQLGITPQRPYASFYPEWETTTPQYQTPTPWSLAQMGYRTNELVYTCIQTRAAAVSEAPMRVYDASGEEKELVKAHPLHDLMRAPTPGLSEQEFWQVVETYCLIAGFSAWEKERDNLGRVIRLWPMRPDWCSYIRGQQKPIAAIRYQPWGLQFADIPIEDVVLFQYFDPLYPLLKGFSPLMAALDLVDTDNTATKMIRTYLSNGNFLGGVLKTEQTLQDAEAERIKTRWREQHAGAENAGDIAVFGKGVEFSPTAQTFRDATFPDLDSRSEARICMVFRVSPMLIGAKIGMDRSTYSNYKEARQGFYEGPISSEWRFLAGQMEEQLLPEYGDGENMTCEFDTRNVKALQEDRNSQVERATKIFTSGIATLNEARKEAQLDPLEGDEGDTRKGDGASVPDPLKPGEDEQEANPPKKPVLEAERDEDEEEEAKSEVASFRRFAKTRVKEGKGNLLASYEFKHLTLDEQGKLLAEFGVHPDTDIIILAQALNKFAGRIV